MLNLVFGLILLFSPLLLINLFHDKKKGFIYTIASVALFHVLFAFITQLLGIFYYWVIIAGTITFDAIAIILFIKYKNKFSFKLSHIDWIGLLVLLVAVISLYQVHYNYSGKINLATDVTVGYHQINNYVYTYPYFSDEWYSIALIKGSIAKHSLPLLDTLNNRFFPNLEMFTHSFLAELMVILNLNPLTQYVLLSIGINSLIVVLCYLFLRFNNLTKLKSAICALSVLYITSAANLPGIWHLIPITLGIMFLLMGLCFMAINKTIPAVFAFIVVSLFYPLLLPFYGFSFLIYILLKYPEIKLKLVKSSGYLAVLFFIFIPVLIIVAFISPWAGHFDYIFSKIFYIAYTGVFIPQFNIFYIIPFPIVLLAILGLQGVYKDRKWLLAPVIVGIIYWVFYYFSHYRFLIEFERIVFFTSILICLVAGFGLEKLSKFKILKYIEYVTLIIFIALIPFYTSISNWQELVSIRPEDGATMHPKAPANKYLTESDLAIFKDIKGKKFLSTPWKGTVIGVATDNYPVVTKEGTISLGSVNFPEQFFYLNCEDKIQTAKKKNLDYIYMNKFDCPNFLEISKSTEGFILYKVIN